jgi:hypothetical protein
MTLSSSDAKAAFLEFGKDLQKISNDLYKAATRTVPSEQKEAAVAAAKSKLAAYEEMLSSVSAPYKSEAADRFGRHIDAIKSDLPKITGGSA